MLNLHFVATYPSTFFAAYQRCGSILVSLISRWTRAMLDQKSTGYIRGKQVKDRGSIVFYVLLFLNAFFLTFFPLYLPRITNCLQQAIIPGDYSPILCVLWLFFTIAGKHVLFCIKQLLFLSNRAFCDQFAAWSFYIYKGVLLVNQNWSPMTEVNVTSRQTKRAFQRSNFTACLVPNVPNLVIFHDKSTSGWLAWHFSYIPVHLFFIILSQKQILYQNAKPCYLTYNKFFCYKNSQFVRKTPLENPI